MEPREDHTKAGMLFLGAFDFPTLSFVAAILAALSAALLFVRGAMVGAATLLGLGFGLSGFTGDVEREVLADLVTGLTPLVFTPLEFVFVARRTDVGGVPATDAGRTRPLRPMLEGLRTGTGGLWWRTGYTLEPIQVEGQRRTHSSREVWCYLSWPEAQHSCLSSVQR